MEDIYVEFDIRINKTKPIIYSDYLDNKDSYTEPETPITTNIIESTTIGAKIQNHNVDSKKHDIIGASYIDNNNEKYRDSNRKNMNRISVVALSTAVLAGGMYITSFL